MNETVCQETKVCRSCGETKPISEYPMRRDANWPEAGLFPIARCRDCERARNRKNARLKRDRAKGAGGYENDVIRYSVAEAERRALGRRVREACRVSAAARRGAERAKQRAASRQRSRWDRGVHFPGMSPRQARKRFNNGVALGYVTRADQCEECGRRAIGYAINAHHDDYEYPMRVRWLCTDCHVVEHSGEWGGHQ